jgi:hypothetical protein
MSSYKPTVILDIDDTMAVKSLGTPDKKKNQRILDQFPGACVWDLAFTVDEIKIQVLHVIPPGWIPCLLYILQNWKWNLALFSSGCKERNELFAEHLAKELKIDKKEIQVYSRHNLVSGDTLAIDGYQLEHQLGQVLYGSLKKDVTRIGLNLDNCVLVDDDKSYIVREQWPQLVVESNGGYHLIAEWILDPTTNLGEESVQDFLTIPFLVLGFLAKCKELNESKGLSLREAMKQLLPPLAIDSNLQLSKRDRNSYVESGYKLLSC